MSLSSWFETHSNSWQCMMAPHMLGARTMKFFYCKSFHVHNVKPSEVRSQWKIPNMKKQHLIVAQFLSFLPSVFIIWLNPIIIKRKWWWWLIVDHVMTWCCSYSRQSASSKQSVLTQPRSGFGEVRPWRSKRVNQKCSMLSWEKSMINCMYLAQVRDKQGCSLLWDRFSTPLVTIEETFWKNAT